MLLAAFCAPVAAAGSWAVPAGGAALPIGIGVEATLAPPAPDASPPLAAHANAPAISPDPVGIVPAAALAPPALRALVLDGGFVPLGEALPSHPLPIPLVTGEGNVAGADAAPSAPGAAPSAAATVGGLALVWLVLEKLGAARALVALYFRVQPGKLLENERRERVVALIRARPGIGPSDIAQDLGTGWGVTSYHLDRLERAGLVASQRVGHHRCYFLPGAVPRDQQRTVGLFRADTTRRIAELVTRSPGIAQAKLCEELGLSASAASKQLSRLEAASLVRRESAQGGLRIFPTPTLSCSV